LNPKRDSAILITAFSIRNEHMFVPRIIIYGCLENSFKCWIKTNTFQVMSQNPESVPFVRRALQISRPDELWSTLAGHAAIANRYSYSICFTWVRQVVFLAFLHSSFQFNLFKSIFSWGMRPP